MRRMLICYHHLLRSYVVFALHTPNALFVCDATAVFAGPLLHFQVYI